MIAKRYASAALVISLAACGGGADLCRNWAVAPPSATLATGSKANFIATLNGAPAALTTWLATGGTIDQDGHYTAGNQPGAYSVTASFVAANQHVCTASSAITEFVAGGPGSDGGSDAGSDAGSPPDGGYAFCLPGAPTPEVIPESDTSVTVFYRTDSSPGCLAPQTIQIVAYSVRDGGFDDPYGIFAQLAGSSDAYHSLTVTGLQDNQPYVFTAQGFGDGGTPSSVSDFSPPVTLYPRPPPPTSLTVQAASTSAVTLHWINPIYDGGVAISFESTYAQLSDAGFAPTVAITTDATSSRIPNLQPGTTYTFAMTSRLANSQESVFSNTGTATTYTPPGVPTNVQAAPGHLSITVSWQPPASSGSGPLTNFYIAQNHTADFSGLHDHTHPAGPDAGSVLVFVTAADAGVQYFEVQAVNQYGTGDYSAPASATALYP